MTTISTTSSDTSNLKRAIWAGVAGSVVAIALVAVSSDGIKTALANAMTYPNSNGVTLDDAASWTLTYLFTVLGLGLIVWLVSLAGVGKGWLRPFAVVAFLIGLALGVYNLFEPLPVTAKIAGLIPAVLGAIAVAVLFSRPKASGVS